jgi:hypothetical protein
MTKCQIERIIKAKYDDYVMRVITDFKRLPDDSRQSGDDGLSDVWEEFKAQLQGEQSFSFSAYEETIQQFIAALLDNMPAHEKELLWHESEGSWDHDDCDKVQPGEMAEEVAEEVYRRVRDVAANELLESEEEELRISGVDIKVLHEIRDVLASAVPRLELPCSDEECMEYVLEDLSNLPSLPSAAWSLSIIHLTPELRLWNLIAEVDGIAVDFCRGQGTQPEIGIGWKRGKRHYRNGTLTAWLAGISEAIASGAKLETSLR